MNTLSCTTIRDTTIDATYVKVRQAGRIVSVAVIVAIGIDADGRREVLGLGIGPSGPEAFWTAFLRKLVRRGLRLVRLVISDGHGGIKAAVSEGLDTTWQRCRAHVMRNLLARAGSRDAASSPPSSPPPSLRTMHRPPAANDSPSPITTSATMAEFGLTAVPAEVLSGLAAGRSPRASS